MVTLYTPFKRIVFFRRYSGWASAIVGGVLLIRNYSTASTDAALVLDLGMHLLLGLILTAVVFAAGAGLSLLVGRRDPPLDDLILRAFLPGTLFLGAAAAVTVYVPFGEWVSISMIAGSLLPLMRYRPSQVIARRAATGLALVLPACLLLASMLALTFHGPTSKIGGSTIGDQPMYLHAAIALLKQFAPLRNLGFEGATLGYGNMLPPLFMAALLPRRWFDPFLFMNGSLVVMTILSLGLMLTMLDSVWRVGKSGLSGAPLWFVGALVTLAPRYPSWIAESPPVAFALPIIVSTVYVWRNARHDLVELGKALSMAVIGSAISKVVIFNVLVPLPLPDLVRTVVWRIDRRIVIFGCIATTAVAIYVGIMLVAYLPEYFPYISLSRYQRRFVLLRACAAVLLAITASKMGMPGLTIAAWIGIGSYLILPFLFDATLMTLMMIMALALIEEPARLTRSWRTLSAALLMLVPFPWFSDPGSHTITIAWGLTASFVVAAAIFVPAGHCSAVEPRLWQRDAAAGLAIMLAVILPIFALGILPTRAIPLNATYIFTPEMRDIWLAVRDRTPSDSLIFTDQTDSTESRLGGWNDYALISERQFFVVSWAGYPPLRHDPAKRAEALRENSDVLSGKLRPCRLHLSQWYSEYFAVISASHPAPPDAVLVYQNAHYRLYQLTG
jgi:hypothetical protein